MNGWIKLYRNLLESDLWCECTPEQKCIAITILLLANHAEDKVSFIGNPNQRVKAGQFKTGISALTNWANGTPPKKGKRNQISERNVRTALKKFQKMGFIEVISSGKKGSDGRLIKVLNWAKYQLNDGHLILEQNSHMEQEHQKKGDNVFDNVSAKNRQRIVDFLTTKVTTSIYLENAVFTKVIAELKNNFDNVIDNVDAQNRQRLVDFLTTKLTTNKKTKEYKEVVEELSDYIFEILGLTIPKDRKPKINWNANKNIRQMRIDWLLKYPDRILSDADYYAFGKILGSINEIIKGKALAENNIKGYKPKDEEKLELWNNFIDNMPKFLLEGNYSFDYIAKNFPQLHRESIGSKMKLFKLPDPIEMNSLEKWHEFKNRIIDIKTYEFFIDYEGSRTKRVACYKSFRKRFEEIPLEEQMRILKTA